MTIPKTATARGLVPHWKVRIVLPGVLLHVASTVEPRVTLTPAGRVQTVAADWITAHEYGDTIGFLDWPAVVAVTWRFAE